MGNDIEAKLEGPPWVVVAHPGNKRFSCWRVYLEMKPGEETETTAYISRRFQPREAPNLTTHILVESHYQSGISSNAKAIQTQLLKIIDFEVNQDEAGYAENCCERYAREDAAKLARAQGMIAVEIDKEGQVLGFVK